MLTLTVSVADDSIGSKPKFACANFAEIIDESIFRAEIRQFDLPNLRPVKIIAHSASLAGCFAIIVSDDHLVLAQAAGRADPYLNLWIRVDGFDLFAHIERGHQVETPHPTASNVLL